MQKINELSNKNKIIYFVALIALGIIVQIGATYVMNGILLGSDKLASLNEEYGEISDVLTTLDFRHITQVIIISPVLEEFVFRFIFIGMVIKVVRDLIGKKVSDNTIFWGVNIFSSLMFGIYHWNLVQFVYASILGLMLGFYFYKMGGYMISLILHMVINTAGLYLAPILPSDITPMGMIAIGSMFLIIALWIIVMTYLKIVNNKE